VSGSGACREELDLGNLRLLRGDPCSGLEFLSVDLLDSDDVDFLRGDRDEAGGASSLLILGVLEFLSALEKSLI
jgi:hypothetical protein